jgi:hypothetical protein
MQDLSRRTFARHRFSRHTLSRRTFLAASALSTLAATISPALRAQHQPCCGLITPAGQRLAATLDSMHVESLWLPDRHINWETGEPDRGAAYEGPGNHTHCSAFAAAAAKRLNVYLLRPPEHGQELLSNAQVKWLPSPEGRKAGWRPVRDQREAQHLANQGQLLLALFENPDPHKPGHVAIVRPSEKPARALEENGPEIIMAGQHNHQRTNVRIGFSNHLGAWPSGVRYFAHTL